MNDAVPAMALARIDEPFQAETWRRARVGASADWVHSAVSGPEVMARRLLRHCSERGIRRLVLVGSSTFARALCSVVAQAQREAVASRGRVVSAPEVVLLGTGAERLGRQHRTSQRRFGNDHAVRVHAETFTIEVVAEMARDHGGLALALLDGGEDAERTAVELAAQLPALPIFLFSRNAPPLTAAPTYGSVWVFGEDWGDVVSSGLDYWERFARIAHDNYLDAWVDGTGRDSQLPWRELGALYRESNLRQLLTTLRSAREIGRSWTQFDSISLSEPGVPTDVQLAAMANIEHDSWRKHLEARGWRKGERSDRRMRHPLLVDWEELDADSKRKTIEAVRNAVDLLASVGYRSSDSDLQLSWAPFMRIGEVTATRTDVAARWTTSRGDEMQALPGDWIIEGHDERIHSVRNEEFVASHYKLGASRWRRTGLVDAVRADRRLRVDTLEGVATAEAGDWIVRGGRGEHWVVPAAGFAALYEAVTEVSTVSDAASARE